MVISKLSSAGTAQNFSARNTGGERCCVKRNFCFDSLNLSSQANTFLNARTPATITTALSQTKRLLSQMKTNSDENKGTLSALREMINDEPAYLKRLKAERIARKIACGDYANDDEKSYLSSADSELAEKASMANYKRRSFENRLQYSRRKTAKAKIKYERFSSALSLDPTAARLYNEGLNKTARRFGVRA